MKDFLFLMRGTKQSICLFLTCQASLICLRTINGFRTGKKSGKLGSAHQDHFFQHTLYLLNQILRDFGSEAYTVQDGTHCEPAISQEIHEPSLRSLLGNPSLELVLNGPVPDPVRGFEPARGLPNG